MEKKITIASKFLLLLIFIVGLMANNSLAAKSDVAYADKKQLTLHAKDITLQEAIQQIQDQSEFDFFYKNVDLEKTEKKVSFNFKGKTIDQVLPKLLKGTDLTYKVMEKDIVIFPVSSDPMKSNNSSASEAFQQQVEISGTVTDAETGDPLPGVNIVVQGTTTGATTDMDGNYSIEAPADATLVYSFVGYQQQSLRVRGRQEIDVALRQSVTELEEVVAIGYGTAKKSDLTGSVSSIRSEDLEEAASMTSIDQGLGGKIAGVKVTQTSGRPGSAVSIRIRGSGSLQGGNEPLYVIDGVPMYSEGFGPGNKLSALSTLNPQDIESMEILKDASATAIYGTRASNGVVLITTKGGEAGRDEVTVNASYGTSRITRKIDVMEALEYAELTNKAYTNDGMDPYYDEARMAEIRELDPGTDWQDELYRIAPTQNYNVRFSGGDEKTTYSVSGNFLNEEGIAINTGFKRYSGRANLTRNISEKFTVSTHMNVTKIFSTLMNEGGVHNSPAAGALVMSPIMPVYTDKEKGEYTMKNVPGRNIHNPVATLQEETREYETTRLFGDLNAEYKIIPELTAKVKLGYDLSSGRRDLFTPSNIYAGINGASGSINSNKTNNWLNENTLTYDKEINENHSLTALGGFTMQKNVWEYVSASSEQFPTDNLRENALNMATVYTSPNSNRTEWTLMSYLGRIKYNMMDKYLVTLNARIDGSSRFGEKNKWGYFPSGAFAWRLSQEDFINNLDVFDNLKLRMSYGITGNQEIGLYNSLSTMGTQNYTFGDRLVTGIVPNKMPNPDLKWEKSKQLDIGLDMGFYNNRLRITADYFDKTTTDLIYNVGIPYTSGFSNTLQNIGELSNKGVDLQIEGDIFTGEFRWTANFNISSYKNKVENLAGEKWRWVGTNMMHSGPTHRLEVGESVAYFYGYKWDGVYQNENELHESSPTNYVGGWKYRDLNGDGVIDPDDRTRIGNPHPDFYGGFTNRFSYKGVSLSVNTQFRYGNDILNFNNLNLTMPTGGVNVYEAFNNYWDGEGSTNKYCKPSTRRSQMFSSRMLEDGSFFKIKNIRLAYSFPNLTANNQFISGLNVYLNLSNYITFTDYRGYDPDVSYQGITNLAVGEDFSQFPRTKQITAGIELQF
jgi:TonB-linked SusC/RagA family outer membrane protein